MFLRFLTRKKLNPQHYYKNIVEESNSNVYSFNKKYANQENILIKMFGNAKGFNKKIRLIVISDTHNCLNEAEFKVFIQKYNNYDICLLLGDHNYNDIKIILKYVDKTKVYGLLGNHDYNYLDEFKLNNLNGKIICINGVKLLGIQGSFKYKPSNFPSFTQKESIEFLNDKEGVDILVSHDSQFNSDMKNNPAHQGLFGITYYLFKNKVPYHIHGHIHNSFKRKLSNGTNEISVYMYEYLELEQSF